MNKENVSNTTLSGWRRSVNEQRESRECEFCHTRRFECWKGNGGLTGIRCINKCMTSYRIDAEILYLHFPKLEENTLEARRKKWKGKYD